MTTLTANMNYRLLWILTGGAFLSFFIFGFVDNLRGPTLPAVLRELNFSYGQGGTILFGAYIGFLVATLLMGILADVLGSKVILSLAGLCFCAGIMAYSYASALWVLVAAMTIVGLGAGSIEVGANALIVNLHSQNRGRYLNLLGVFHGTGALVVPLYAGQLLQNGFSWREVYRFSLVLAIVLALFFVIVKAPPRKPTAGGGLSLGALGKRGFNGQMGWFYLMIALYVSAELGIGAWVVEFLQEARGFSVGLSSLYLSLFFGFIMLGRLLGSVLVERIGYLRVMLYAMILAMVCLTLGIFGPPAFVFFIPLTGTFFSIIFPTTTAAVATLHPEKTGTMLGLLFTFGGVGGAIGPWAIGVTSDWAGIEMGFGLIILYCFLVVVALLVLRQKIT